MKFLQINLHHCSDANTEMVSYSIDKAINVVLIQDPYILAGRVSGVPLNWPCFLSDNLSAGIIFTNPDYTFLKCLVDKSCVFVSLNVSSGIIYIGSHYSPPSGNLDAELQEWSGLFPEFDNILIGGDLNVPMRTMGYTRGSGRTEILMDHLQVNNLCIVNDTEAHPTFVQGSLSGRPDLTLAGYELSNHLFNWNVDINRYSFSDHRFITYDLDYSPVIRDKARFKTRGKNFKKFNEIFAGHKREWLRQVLLIKTPAELDDWVQGFSVSIHNIMTMCFKRGTITHKPTFNWFTTEIKTARNHVSALYKRYRRNLENEAYRNTYLEFRNKYKRQVREAKKKAWYQFCAQTNDSFGNLYKFINGKQLKTTDLIFTSLEDSLPFASYDDVAERLMQEHYDINNVPDDIFEYISDKSYENDNDFYNISFRELKYALSQQANAKAPGWDDLDALTVKNICCNYPEVILAVFNRCLSLGHFPRCWKDGIVIYFRKRNKPATSPRGYRPITLLSILAKVLERIIKNRVTTVLEASGYIDNNQHGFREKRSTVTALFAVKDNVNRILSTNKYCTIVSLDIQGAFDAACWRTLAVIIDSLPIAEYLKSSLKNYISNRRIGFKFANGIRWFIMFRGCPQGSCLGPFIWTVLADKLIKEYKQSHTYIVSYADDFVILEGADTRSSLEDKVNGSLDTFLNICTNLNLSLSIDKCIAVMMGRYTLEKRNPIFKINNISIPVKRNISYLGFHLDNRFNWLYHLDLVRENIRNFSIDIRKTGSRDRGLLAKHRKIWYLQVIEKQIAYGSEVWFRDLNSHGIRRLSSCQRAGLMTIIKTYRNVSTDSLCTITGVPPLYIKLKMFSKRYDVTQGMNSMMIGDYEIKRDNLMLKLKTYDFPEYNNLRNIYFIPDVKSIVPASMYPTIYTDGSRMDQGTSSAFTVLIGDTVIYDYAIRLRPYNTVYQAELFAIECAVRWFVDSGYLHVRLYTDSLSSVLSLQRLFPLNSIIRNIFELLVNNPTKKLFVGWIKAHVGLFGNERADANARNAILYDCCNKNDLLPFPISFVNAHMRKSIMHEWQQHWSNSYKGRDTYAVFNKVDSDYLCSNEIIQFYITAHGSFPAFLCKIGKRPSSLCDCGVHGDVLHYLYGRCVFMVHHFRFMRDLTVRQNLTQTLLDPNNYHKLKDNYNVLNALYSFIKYKY